MPRVLIATSNAGKLRDFAAAASEFAVEIAPLPNFRSLPEPVEDQPTFEGNARKKAEHYSRFAPGEIVLADDSGLEVMALGGAPGVHSARYAALRDERVDAGERGPQRARIWRDGVQDSPANSSDEANNARLLR